MFKGVTVIHIPGLNFKPFHVTISEVPSIAQGISTQVMLFVMILQPLCHGFNVHQNFILTGPHIYWNMSFVYIAFKLFKHSENFNIPKTKVETAPLTPAVIQGILIAPRESK